MTVHRIRIEGHLRTVTFDYPALSLLYKRWGGEYSKEIAAALTRFDVPTIAELLAIGLAKHHPEFNADRIMRASPPLLEACRVISEAYNQALWGGARTPWVRRLRNWFQRLFQGGVHE